MELPVIPPTHGPTNWTREFARLEVDWCRGVSAAVEVSGATVFSSDEFPRSNDANAVANAWLPPGVSWPDFYAEVAAACPVPARRWWLNPSMGADRTEPVASALTGLGWRRTVKPLLRWTGGAEFPPAVDGVVVVPARSAYLPLAAMFDRRGEVTAVSHLDDPQVDSWVALSAGRAVAVATVQISGQSAALRDWYVDSTFETSNVGRVTLGRALDLCRRAEVANVLALGGGDDPLEAAGFSTVDVWEDFVPQ